jgi:ribosome-binding factor A
LELFIPERQDGKNRRPNKVALRIRECIALAILRGDLPIGPPCQITITYVSASPDLRNATIFFTTSDDAMRDSALGFFESQKYYFRGLIAKQVKLKFVPNISFKIDDSIENAKKIEILLNQKDPK